MDISYQEAWNRAAYYLTTCCGFPENAKCELKKTRQTYMEPLKQHKVTFTLVVDHPTPVIETSSPPQVGYKQAVEDQKAKEIDKPFALMRELLSIIEKKHGTKRLKKDGKPKH